MCLFFFSSRRRHTRCALVTGVQTCALPISGSLIHIGSQMGHVGAPNRSLYCASKWALEGMNKAIALDLAPHRIRSNTIAPPFIETPLTKPFLQATAFLDSVLAKIQLARIGQTEDPTAAIPPLDSNPSQLLPRPTPLIHSPRTP